MNTKRILIFSLVYYPRYIGGAEVAIKEITDRLPKGDYEFDMVTLRKGQRKSETIGNVRVHRTGSSKYLFTFLGAWCAMQLHKKNHYDAIWSSQANYAGFAAVFFKMTHMRVPFILTLQEGDTLEHYKKRVGILLPLYRKIFLLADRIQTISNYLAGFAKDMGGKNVVVVSNGVDVEKFAVPQYPRSVVDTTTEVITSSRLTKKNAVIDIIRAMQFLPDTVHLSIAGVGEEESMLRREVDALKLDNRVTFKGFISHDDLPGELSRSDIFVRPSLTEGFGNSFIEAMAARVPVIATRVGGIPDFLKDKETGLFCAVRDPKDIAHKIEIYMHDHALRAEIVENAYAMVKAKYDWNIIARDMDEKVFKPIFS